MKNKTGYKILDLIVTQGLIYLVIALLISLLSLLVNGLDFSWKLVTIIFLVKYLIQVCIPAASQARKIHWDEWYMKSSE